MANPDLNSPENNPTPEADSPKEEPKVFPLNGLATLDQACDFLQCSRTHLWHLGNKNLVDRVNIGYRTVRIRWESLHAFVDKCSTKAPPITPRTKKK